MSEGRAAQLRRAFDRSFAEGPAGASAATEDLLAVRVGAGDYAVRLAEVARLYRDRRVTRLPGATPPVLGIAGLQGMLVPVFDLGALLETPGSIAPGGLLLAAAEQVALAVDGFGGLLLRSRPDLPAAAEPRSCGRFVRDLADVAGVRWPVLDLGAIVAAIGDRVGGSPSETREG